MWQQIQAAELEASNTAEHTSACQCEDKKRNQKKNSSFFLFVCVITTNFIRLKKGKTKTSKANKS